jgi:hypothetical protein
MLVALPLAEAAVVGGRLLPAGGDVGGQLLGLAPGGDVDDAGPRRGDRPLDHGPDVFVVGQGLHRQVQVVPHEARHDDDGVAHAELLDDLPADGRRRGGRQGHDLRPPERLDERSQPEVVGPEVVTPGADAVGLVDDEDRRLRRLEKVQRLRIGQLLRCDEDELEVAVGQLGERVPALGPGHRGVHLPGAAEGLADGGHLILLESDERGDDHGGAGHQRSGDLIDGRFPRSRRHDGQHVASGHDGGRRRLLPGPQVSEAERGTGHLGHEVHHLVVVEHVPALYPTPSVAERAVGAPGDG